MATVPDTCTTIITINTHRIGITVALLLATTASRGPPGRGRTSPRPTLVRRLKRRRHEGAACPVTLPGFSAGVGFRTGPPTRLLREPRVHLRFLQDRTTFRHSHRSPRAVAAGLFRPTRTHTHSGQSA